MMMTEVAAAVSPFVAACLRDAGASVAGLPARVAELRREGLAAFERMGLPTRAQEAWRFTDVKPLRGLAFAAPEAGSALAAEDVTRLSLACDTGARFVFVNGRFQPGLSSPPPSGARVRPLTEALAAGDPAMDDALGRIALVDAHPFTALNAAFLGDGAAVSVDRGADAERAIHLLFIAGSADPAPRIHPRIVVTAAPGSRAVIVEEYVTLGDGVAFSNPVTEIAVGANASVEHYRLQRESEAAFHLGEIAVRMERDARFTGHSISLGGRLVRQDVGVVLAGEGAECTLNGLYVAAGKQHVDHHTRVDHAASHTVSRELYKGVLDGKATGVFNGRVRIREGVAAIDAGQTNNNLLLSGSALVNTNPELEIFADDVKAVHGATIGQIEDEELFYLRSRGIDERTARHILIQGFAGEMLDRITLAPLRDRLASFVEERF